MILPVVNVTVSGNTRWCGRLVNAVGDVFVGVRTRCFGLWTTVAVNVEVAGPICGGRIRKQCCRRSEFESQHIGNDRAGGMLCLRVSCACTGTRDRWEKSSRIVSATHITKGPGAAIPFSIVVIRTGFAAIRRGRPATRR